MFNRIYVFELTNTTNPEMYFQNGRQPIFNKFKAIMYEEFNINDKYYYLVYVDCNTTYIDWMIFDVLNFLISSKINFKFNVIHENFDESVKQLKQENI